MNEQLDLILAWLDDKNFSRWSDWKSNDGQLKYTEVRTLLAERPYLGKWVYLFLEEDFGKELANTLYIGKTNKLIGRLDRHQSEMNNGNLLKRKERMIASLQGTCHIWIYVRHSEERIGCLGEQIDAYHLEEIAAIKHLSPIWNYQYRED